MWSSSFCVIMSHVRASSAALCFVSDGGLGLQLQRSVSQLDYHREETSQIPSNAPNPQSQPPLTDPCFASINSSFHTLFDTNAEHHPLSLLPVQPGAGRRSGARVQTEVNRKWLFSQAPRSWPPSPPLLFFSLSPHALAPRPRRLTFTLRPPRRLVFLAALSCKAAPLCFRLTSENKAKLLVGKEGETSLSFFSFRPQFFKIPSVHKNETLHTAY